MASRWEARDRNPTATHLARLSLPRGYETHSAVELDDLGHTGGRLGRTDGRRRRNLGRNEGSEATWNRPRPTSCQLLKVATRLTDKRSGH